jgi:hypothetical protein
LQSTATVANASPILEGKIEETTAGLPSSFAKHLSSTGENNVITIIEYIAAVKNEVNLSDNYRKDLIESLARFSKYNDNKPFKVLTRSNVIAFLESLRKTETQDPMHRWIGTYNLFRIICCDFSSGSIILISNPARGLNLQ